MSYIFGLVGFFSCSGVACYELFEKTSSMQFRPKTHQGSNQVELVL